MFSVVVKRFGGYINRELKIDPINWRGLYYVHAGEGGGGGSRSWPIVAPQRSPLCSP